MRVGQMFNVRRVVSMIEGSRQSRGGKGPVDYNIISALISYVQMYLLNCSNVYMYPFF